MIFMKNVCLALALALSAIFVSARAQTTNPNSIEFTPVYSLNVFSPGAAHLSGTVWGAEAAYHVNMQANQAPCMRILNVQSVDAVFSYRNLEQVQLNNDAQTKGALGSTFSVLGRLEFGLAKLGPVRVLFTPGIGFLYATQTYYTNPHNVLVGSHINLAIQAGLKAKVNVSGTTAMQAGIGIFHYSNGAVNLPNNGINAFDISLGVVKSIRQPGPVHEATVEKITSAIEFGGDIGYRGNLVTQNGSFHKGLYVGYNYRLIPILSLKAAVDAVHANDVFDPSRFNETFQSYASHYDRWRAGASLGLDAWFGPLAVMTSYGHYFRNRTYYPNNQWYWTAGLKYYVLPYAAIQIKGYLHGAQAEYIGAGLLFRVKV
jgi:hypothetical protein